MTESMLVLIVERKILSLFNEILYIYSRYNIVYINQVTWKYIRSRRLKSISLNVV